MSATDITNHKFSRRSALIGATGALATLAASRADAAVAAAKASAPTVGGATTWLNVRSFGAAGDGTADDTAALNAACDAARSYFGAGDGVPVVYVPAGLYKITNTINVWNVFMKGDGQGASRIIAAYDWAARGAPNSSWALDQQPSSGAGGGVGLPAPDANHIGYAPKEGTWIEDLWVNGPTGTTPGVVNCHLSGIRVGNGAGYSRLRIEGFFAGAFLFSDHEKLLGPGSQGGNYYGVYYGEPSQSSGDQVISDIQLDGAGWASIGISSGKIFGNAAFRKLHLGMCPFGIYKEEATSGPMLAGVVLGNVSFESCGNGNIFVNGASGAGADVESCVFDGTTGTNSLDPGVRIPTSTRDANGRQIGRMLAPIDLGAGQWLDNEVLASDPAYPHPGVTSYSALVACGMFVGGRYGPGEGGLYRVAQDGKQFTTGGNNGDAVIMSRGTASRLLRASGNGMVAGDLVESAGGGQPGARRSTGTRRAIGVALHAANDGQSVPVAYTGLVTVRCGANTIAANSPLVADVSQVGCVASGTITSPGIVGVAQQPSSGGVVAAILQGL